MLHAASRFIRSLIIGVYVMTIRVLTSKLINIFAFFVKRVNSSGGIQHQGNVQRYLPLSEIIKAKI